MTQLWAYDSSSSVYAARLDRIRKVNQYIATTKPFSYECAATTANMYNEKIYN